MIYHRGYSKILDKEAFKILLKDFFTAEFDQVHFRDYNKYKIAYFIERDFSLLFLFINDKKDDHLIIRKELINCKGNFLDMFKEILPNSIDAKLLQNFDEQVDLIQNKLPPIISLAGFGGVGKSSITNLIRTKKIPLITNSEFNANIAKIKIGRIIFLVRDFIGEQEVGFLWNNFIKNSDLVLIVTDSSLGNVEKSRFFLSKIEEEIPNALRIAIGNKAELQNAINSDQIEKILGMKSYSINTKDPENKDKLIEIIINTLEMRNSISPILEKVKERESLLDEFKNELMMVNIEKADSIYKEILIKTEELGENPYEMEFHHKYQEILSKLESMDNKKALKTVKSSIKDQDKDFQTIASLEGNLKTLLLNYLNNSEGILGVIVSDREGFVITSESKKETEDESILGAIAVTIDTYIERIKKEFSSETNFFNITNIQNKKFAYCSMGSKSILLTISNLSTSDTELRIFSEHIASKIELLLEGNRNVSLEIPEIVKILSKTKDGKIPKGEFSFKMIITGDFAVGKTSLIRRFVQDLFKEEYHSTIGVDISQKVVDLSEHTKINFIIWDIGGQMPKMAPYRTRFYEGAKFAFIVIDRSRSDCLESVHNWYDEITKSTDMDVIIVLVDNKSDMSDELIIDEKEIKNVAKKYNFHYISTSAKTGENVNDAFLYLAYRFLETI